MTCRSLSRLFLISGAFAALGLHAARAVGSFDIVIAPGSALAANPAALAAFNRAAASWENRFSDPITITINADLGSNFGNPNIIGSTSSVILSAGYSTIRNAMAADAVDEPSNAIVASLPVTPSFTLKTGVTATGSANLTKANAKALGFTGLDTTFGTSDATITFNNAFNFDYNSSDGVTAGLTDFQTVAAHEIGHALGFISGVDDVDGGATAVTPTTLDLFRFANGAAPTNAAEFATFPRDLRPGQEAVTSDTVNNYRMSTGVALGDGRQASHWKVDELIGPNIGIMDPTLAPGVSFLPSEADYRAFDLIGYELVAVPEPATALAGALCGLLALRGIRRARMGSGQLSPAV